MCTYRRALVAGGVHFFTLNLAERHGNDLLVPHMDTLRDAFHRTKQDHPFHMVAVCILPEHLHCIPDWDADLPTRWSLIKQRFSRAAGDAGVRSALQPIVCEPILPRQPGDP